MTAQLLKAVVVGARVADALSQPVGEKDAFALAGALEPPHDPGTLCDLLEHSSALRPNVDAYVTNIDGFGHRLEPVIDLDGDDADARVADLLMLEQVSAGEEPRTATPDEVAARRRELVRLARVERARLDAFFSSCTQDYSFVELRRRTRRDLEVTGNAYWEVLRNGRGEVARLVHVPSHSVRLLPLEGQSIDVTERVRSSPVSFEAMATRRRFRRFVQVLGQERVFFRAFGDPRVLSRVTGREGDGPPATEMIHFVVHSPRSPYGAPRWIGTLLSVMGSRQMEEVNFLYFDNKSVPPLALLVSGGRLSEASVPRIERFIEENLKGRENFHRILILEAEGPTGDGPAPKIELRPLTDAQQKDALFAQYDDANRDKVGVAFRLPRLLRGDSRDYNRAVADAQLYFTETQVFQPERAEFDHFINHRLFVEMQIRFWRFRSQAPVARDPERMTAMVEKLVRVGVLTPEEGRHLAGDIFNRDFSRIAEDWVKRPITLTLAGIQTGSGPLEPRTVGVDALDDGGVRDRWLQSRDEEERRDAAEQEAERIFVPDEEWKRWFTRPTPS